METELQVAFYFQTFISFKKNQNKILEVANHEYNKHVKSQYELLYILGHIEITKYDKLYSVEMCIIY
jgi:ABC-type enterochelin transport system permease subunit